MTAEDLIHNLVRVIMQWGYTSFQGNVITVERGLRRFRITVEEISDASQG